MFTASLSTLLLPILALGASPPAAEAGEAAPEIVSVARIWDEAPHSAFTDLIRFQDTWLCTFREGDGHVGGDGAIRILASDDGEKWRSRARLTLDGVDLRDPKLSITPDGRLMLLAGGSIYDGSTLVTYQSRVAFSDDGENWTPFEKVWRDRAWLWRVTWHDGIAYGMAYTHAPGGRGGIELVSSADGRAFESVVELDVEDRPNEVTLRFQEDGTMIALVRREAGPQTALIGQSAPPYRDWRWADAGHRVGGPEFIILPGGAMWAAGRDYGPPGPTTVLARMTAGGYTPALTLPSGGDTSYPGLVWHDGLLWMSYYASHEERSSIYIARIALPEP